jgi:type IV pilus assembly protein PilZ
MSVPFRTGSQPGIMPVIMKTKQDLYQAYMPFIKNGGLFIRTDNDYKIGDEIFLLLTLVESNERLPVAAKVAWITPRGAQNKRPPGVGVSFNLQDGGETQKRIELQLAELSGSELPTFTL